MLNTVLQVGSHESGEGKSDRDTISTTQKNFSKEEAALKKWYWLCMGLPHSLLQSFLRCETEGSPASVLKTRTKLPAATGGVFWRLIQPKGSCPVLCSQSCRRRSAVFQPCVLDNNILCLWNVSANKGVPFKSGLCKPVHGRGGCVPQEKQVQ